MRRLVTILRRTVAALAVLSLVGLLLYLLVLPGVVEKEIRAALEAGGFADADFRFVSVDPGGLLLAEFRLDAEGRVAADSVEVTFDIASLRAGRVHEVRVTGARIEVGIADGELDLGPLSGGGTGEGASGPLPLDAVVLRSSRLTILEEGRSRVFPVDGRIDVEGPDSLRFALESRFREHGISLSGQARPGEGTADATIRLGTEETPDRASVRARLDEQGVRLDVDARSARLEVGGVGAVNVRLAGGLLLRDGDTIADLSLEASADSVLLAGRLVREANLTLETTDDAGLVATLTARHEDLVLERARAAGLPTAVAAILAEDLQAEIGFLLKGTLPRADRETLAAAGLVLAAETRVEAEGSATVFRSGETLAKVHATELVLRSPSAGLAAAGVTLTDVSARVLLSAEAGRDGLRLTLGSGSRVDAAVDRMPGLAGSPVRSTLELREDLVATASREGDAFTLSAPSARLTLEADGEETLVGGTVIGGLAANLALEAEIDEARARVVLSTGSTIELDSLRTASGVELRPLRLEVPAADLEFAADLRGGRWAAAGALETSEPVAVSAGALRANLRHGTVTGAARSFSGGIEDAAAALDFDGLDVLLPGAELAARGIAGHLPLRVAGGDDEEEDGWFEAKTLRLRGVDFPGLRGRAARKGTVLGIDASWAATPTAKLEVHGRLDLAGGVPRGVIAYEAPDLTVRAGDAVDRLLSAAAGGFHLTGGMAVDGRLVVSGAGVEPESLLTLRDATLRGSEGKLELTNLSAKVRLDRFPRTPGGQVLRFEGGRVGELAVGPGRVVFTVEGPRSLLLESARFRLGTSGLYTVQSFRVDPTAPDLRLEIHFEDVALADWLSIVTGGRATGDGRLYGRLPVRIRTRPKLDVAVGEGFLRAIGGGTFRIPDADLVGEMLDENAASLGDRMDMNKLVRDRIVGSLQDFIFSTLTFDVVSRRGGMTLTVRAAGKGRRVPQEIDLTVNFNGFDKLIGPALGMKLGIDHAREEAMRIFGGR